MPGSPKDRLIRATSWHAAGRVAAGLLGVVHAAYAFHALGEAGYGLLTLAALAALLLVPVEFGLRSTTVRFAAEAAARGDAAAASRVLGSATLVHLAAGAAVALPFAALAGPLADAFAVEEAMRGEAVALLRWTAVLLVLGNAASGWTSVLVALQRTGPLAASMAAGGLAQIAGTVAGVRAGMGAPSLALGFAAATATRAILEAVAVRRTFPGVSILPWRASREALGRLRAAGRGLQVSRVVDVLIFTLDQVLVSRFLGVAAGGVYRFASDLALKLREAPLLLSAGVLPAAAEVRHADGGEAVRRLYLRGTKYVFAAAAFVAAFTAAASPRVLEALGGEGAAAAAPVLAILALGVLANVGTGVATQVGVALARTDLQGRAALVSGAVSVLLVPAALLLGLGAPGAAAGTALALAAGTAAYLGPFHRVLGVPGRTAFRASYLPPLPPALLVGGAVILLNGFLPAELWAGGKAQALALLCAEGAIAGALYLGLLMLSGWLDAFDRDVIRRALAPGAGGKAP